MKEKIKFFLILLILLSIYIYVCAYSYVSAVSNNLSEGVFRLHILANSNSEEDQNLKYVVRDKLSEYMKTIIQNCSSKSEVIQIAQNNLKNFQRIAKEVIQNEGFDYSVDVCIGNFEFPTKTYGDISFPAGFYDALKVKIGKAEGHNWWCVMFPPLCFINPTTGIVTDESKETLKENLSKENYCLISDSQNSTYTFKFKLIEFFENNNLIISNK